MSSTATADSASAKRQIPKEIAMTDHDDAKSNHNLPARTAADDEKREHPQQHKDDPATMAASEELKHTTISDKVGIPSRADLAENEVEPVSGADKEMSGTVKASTTKPDVTEAQDEEMKERISSPKKKRGRDTDEDVSQLDEQNADGPGVSADVTLVNGSRITGAGPEKKKRVRDTSEEYVKSPDEEVTIKLDGSSTTRSAPEPQASLSNTASDKLIEDTPQTSPTAFAGSGFASLAQSSTSGFGGLGASKPGVFGGGSKSSISGFGALATTNSPSTTTTTTTTSSLGAPAGEKGSTGFSFSGGTTSGFGTGASSGFGGLASGSVFGASLGKGFGGGAGPKLSSFAAPGVETPAVGSKPVKAFGAPEVDNEEEGSDPDDTEGGEEDEDAESNTGVEEKKKAKTTKVPIDDGETGEVTLLSVRAKLFALDSKDVGWKERGVGTLKINVPKSCASFDENDVVIPGSFDPSGLDEEDMKPNAPRAPRLIMRQENTHRVVLNTIILRGMEFQDKPSATAALIMFMAFESDKDLKPTQMQLKLNEANAKLLRAELDSIKRELL